MGGKSSSSNTSSASQTTTETNVSAANSGVTNAETILQGQTINFDQQFGPEVQKAFSDVINLTGDAGKLIGNAFEDIVMLAQKSIDLTGNLADRSIDKVSNTTIAQTQPQLSAVNSFVPVMVIVAIGFAVYMYRKG